MFDYTPDVKRRMTNTEQKNPKISRRATVRSFLPRVFPDKSERFLDLGSGRHMRHTKYFRRQGYNDMNPYDIDRNFVKGKMDEAPFDSRYDVVFGSSMMNVQPDRRSMEAVVDKAKGASRKAVAFNYPEPYHSGVDVDEFEGIMKKKFKVVEKYEDYDSPWFVGWQ